MRYSQGEFMDFSCEFVLVIQGFVYFVKACRPSGPTCPARAYQNPSKVKTEGICTTDGEKLQQFRGTVGMQP